MQAFSHLLLVCLASLTAAQNATTGCIECTNNSTDPIVHVPAPWELRGTVYSILLTPLLEGILGTALPTKAYGPLERQYASAMEGDYQGVLGMIQIIRYTEGPVGPYDELLIIPGFFGYNRPNDNGSENQKSNVRITRIYVSQKYTAWNGRYNWNIPKHLANFDWTESADGVTTVKVYPYDTTGDTSESYPATKPWFQTSFRPGLLNDITSTTDLYALLGIDATLVQPPLPQGNDSFGALIGTKDWQATVPGQFSRMTSTGTFDLDQGEGDEVGDSGKNAVGDEFYPNFWPNLSRYSFGLKMEDTTITFSAPESWS